MMKHVREAVILVVQVIAMVFVTKSFAFATHYIPSESMAPTLQIGDRIIVSHWPYGFSRYSLPVDPGFDFPGKDRRILDRLPQRGDIAVFTRPRDGETLIKRVIGLPGDRISLHEGRLYINGALVERIDRGRYAYRDPYGGVAQVHRYEEVLPGGRRHAIIERTDYGAGDEFAEITIPAGQLFVMGDNRDNSLDSRFAQTGLVPVEKLQGRADLIGWTLYSCKEEPGLSCADKRFMSRLN